jgi:hypothetical protein
MCEKCLAARVAAIPALAEGLKASGNDGARLVAALLMLQPPGQPSPPQSAMVERVDNLMLDSYEQQRRDARNLASWLIVRLTMIKNRLMEESHRAGDKDAVALEWDGEKQGFNVKGRTKEGEPFEQFFPMAYGENPAQAAMRIGTTYLASIGEIHDVGDDF